ncbi:MAG: GNAT family N-acetyltransferase [Chloroflexi bacterium]|nr:GNAT family N-acetyltransferase [Chloroflexota bacterium]
MIQMKIRPLNPNDTADLYEMMTDPRVVGTLVFTPSMEYQDEEAWVKNKRPGSHRLVAEIDGKVVGSATIGQNLRARTTHSGHLGLLVHADYWGRGIGSALMTALLDLADNWLNLMRVELEVFAGNPAAIHIYQKFGFEIEGTQRMAIFGGDGRFHDEHVMARIREPLPAPVNRKPSSVDRHKSPVANRQQPATIRPQHPGDAAAMHNLWRHPLVARTTMQMPSLEYPDAARKVKNRPDNGHRFVAEVDGRVVGSAGLFVNQNPRQAHSARLGMMVHPDFWGQGIGGQLMEAALNLADNWLNLKRVELEVHNDNPVAIHLYEKFDFVIEGTKRYHTYGDGRWAHTHFMARIRN